MPVLYGHTTFLYPSFRVASLDPCMESRATDHLSHWFDYNSMLVSPSSEIGLGLYLSW